MFEQDLVVSMLRYFTVLPDSSTKTLRTTSLRCRYSCPAVRALLLHSVLACALTKLLLSNGCFSLSNCFERSLAQKCSPQNATMLRT